MALERSSIFCRHSREHGNPACDTHAKRRCRRAARFKNGIPAFARMTALGERYGCFERTKLGPRIHEDDDHRRHVTWQICE